MRGALSLALIVGGLAFIACEPVVETELESAPTPPFPPSFTTVPTNVKPVLFDRSPVTGAPAVGDDVFADDSMAPGSIDSPATTST